MAGDAFPLDLQDEAGADACSPLAKALAELGDLL